MGKTRKRKENEEMKGRNEAKKEEIMFTGNQLLQSYTVRMNKRTLLPN